MKIPVFMVGVIIASALFAGEPITFKTREGREYKDVAITKVDPAGIQIMIDSGIERIPVEKLPEALQKQFNFNPNTAAQYENAARAAQARMASEQVRAASAVADAETAKAAAA